jgi:5-methyltetrahydrofolate--homocysteine methyltransferase
MEEYNRMYLIHGLSVQLAEALAGYVHDHIRKELRIAEGSGKRYSPGYPLWKDLADQRKLFKLLRIKENIGVDLTEECQLVPEQSTTAMVVHSALAEY